MLDTPTAVGFVSTTDAARARAFYGDLLGLRLADDGFALVADVGGAQLRITTLPGFKAGEAPAFGFNVSDVPTVAAKLRAPLAPDAVEIAVDGDAIVVKHPMYTGKVVGSLRITAQPALLSVRLGAIPVGETPRAGRVEPVQPATAQPQQPPSAAAPQSPPPSGGFAPPA